jgi:hypothetical protein
MFDDWKCTERHFRFGSVGEDARICLWDFTVAGLKRTKLNVRLDLTDSLCIGENLLMSYQNKMDLYFMYLRAKIQSLSLNP